VLGGITVLKNRDKVFILKVLKRLERGVVLLATHKIVGMIDSMQNLERVPERIRGVGNVLTDGLCIDQSTLLLSKLLGAGLDGLVELEDLGS